MSETELKITYDPAEYAKYTGTPTILISDELLNLIVAKVLMTIAEKLALSSREPQVAPADDFIDKLAGRVKERLGLQD